MGKSRSSSTGVVQLPEAIGGMVWERQVRLPIETRVNSVTMEARANIDIPARILSEHIPSRGNEIVDSRELNIII